MLDAERIAARFEPLSAHLRAHRRLYEARAFVSLRLPWEADMPEVSRWLRGLEPDVIDTIEDREALPEAAPAALRALAETGRRLTEVGPVRAARAALDKRLAWRVPGRKWEQVRAFAAHALEGLDGARPARVVDWCGGKGHLGRTLASVHGCDLTIVERDGDLAGDAAELAARAGVACRFEEADALSPRAAASLGPASHAVGLHACGNLTDALLRGACAAGVEHLAASMCCFHKTARPGEEVALSEAGRASGVAPTFSSLRLSISDEVVAPARARRARRRETAWRLGLDLLLREGSGVDRYTPLGAIPPDVLRLDFEPFARRLSAERGLPLPASWDAARAEAAGFERARVVRGLGLMRAFFRRPLEVWMVSDRALYLAERGRRVRVLPFCERALTPRNLLVIASGA